MSRFVEVLLPFGGADLFRTFTYQLPDELDHAIAPGDPVTVPFRTAVAHGIVVSFSENPLRSTRLILGKDAHRLPVSREVLDRSRWLAERYAAPWWEALRGFLLTTERHARLETPTPAASPLPTLTPEQEEAARRIREALQQRIYHPFLLHGITGSGKTEVYLQATLEALNLGKGVLVLVPEIPLSFQVAGRFQDAFGNRVAVIHSGLADREKREAQSRIREGKATIVVGARMALFAPHRALGLIVVDEEHDTSYKQESHPRYQTVVLAERMAQEHRSVLILGSATPSVESFYLAREGKRALLSLPFRYESRPLPRVHRVDLRDRQTKTRGFLTLPLLDALSRTLQQRQQAILFLNRRGFSPLVQCTACGHTFKCPHCNITLTLHLREARFRCHYCDFKQPAPPLCPRCQQGGLSYRGIGTERLEEDIRRHFPKARVLRLDRDTASRRGSTQSIVETFARGGADILVGTQMVTKGFHFPHVNLVGILYADRLLHFPDFRAAERTFQLLTQVAGRAGRGSAEGRVILQTCDPEHPAIQAAAEHRYDLFYEQEIAHRKSAQYPPFVSLANLVFSGTEEPLLLEAVQKAHGFLKERLSGTGITLLGPAPCPLERINRRLRWHFLLKSSDIQALPSVGRALHTWHAEHGLKKISLAVDLDPVHLL